MTTAGSKMKPTSGDGTENAAAVPLPATDLRKMDAYWRACQLPVGRADLSPRQPATEGAAQAGAHQAATARPLGYYAGPEHALRPPQPGHQESMT